MTKKKRARRAKKPVQDHYLPPSEPVTRSQYWNLYVDGLSPSAIRTFVNCREEFRLAFVEGWTTDKFNASIEFGNVFHAAKQEWIEQKDLVVNDFLHRYEKSFVGKFSSIGLTPADRDAQADNFLAFRALWPVYSSTYSDDLDEKWLANEESMSTLLEDVPIRGVLDGCIEKQRLVRVRDLKSKGIINWEAMQAGMHQDLQLMTYMFLAVENCKRKPEMVELDIVRNPSKKRKSESAKEYIKRMRQQARRDTGHYMRRLKCTVSETYLKTWTNRVLRPIVKEIKLWEKGELAHYGSGAHMYQPKPWTSQYTDLIFRGKAVNVDFIQDHAYAYEAR